MSDSRQHYALVGTGGRAGMFVQAIAETYPDSSVLAGLCDLSQVRMDHYNKQLTEEFGQQPAQTYVVTADDLTNFDRMIAETKPATVIVTTMDATHHRYIVRAMELGCDVISEKPMTTDVEKARAIYDAIDRTGQSLRVTFNYRYAPAYTKLREVIMSGAIGRPLCVDFSWLLDTYHGADYFRRWHREKHNSGGLLVHKATHHFDLINWWIDSYPETVSALGSLSFYGAEAAAGRGEHYDYPRYTGVPAAQDDPFAISLDANEGFRELYLAAEAETGYLRDRNVFGEPITIEDTMTVTVRYQNGVLLSYCLVAYSPWEGMHVGITGSKGRVELDIVEKTHGLSGFAREDHDPAASKGGFKGKSLRVMPQFKEGYVVEIPEGTGGHGGGDRVMLEQIFAPDPPADPFNRAASHLDGAASIMLGISANRSMATGEMVRVNDLFPLPKKG